MAGEITASGSLICENGLHVIATQVTNLSVDQAAQGGNGGVVAVGTAEENMPVGDVSTLGWVFVRNLDDVNYVTWGPDSSGMVAIGRLEPGEFAIFRLEPGVTLRWQANTASCNVFLQLLED